MSNPEIIRAIPVADAYLISPIMDLAAAKQRLQEFQSFVRDYLVEGEDFGKIPGAPKPTLLKPGADKLCELYGLSDDYEFIERVEDYDRGLFDYTIKCILTSRRHGVMVSSGLGCCSSLESKYRWRDSRRLCPQCGKDTIIKGKEEYGGGWICFAKKGGCGAKFSPTDEKITGQTIGRTLNEDIADLKNTILKMAKKRAKVDATLSATRSSGVFTQDLEDMPHGADLTPPPTSVAPEKAAPAPGDVSQQPPTEAQLEADRVAWLDTITPLSPEEFVEQVAPKLKDKLAASLVRCVNRALLDVLFNRLADAEAFSKVLLPLNKVAFDIDRKSFIQAVSTEAKQRGYKVNRTTGSYEEGKANG